jgi:Tol biopolymer transport system component
MKSFHAFLFVISLIFCFSSCKQKCYKTDNYFAQECPTDSAIIFAPDEVSITGQYEYGISFSPDGTKMIYGVQPSQNSSSYLMYSEYNEGVWPVPEKVKLLDRDYDGEMEAYFTPDGKAIYFAGYDTVGNCDIYKIGVNFKENVPEKLIASVNKGVVFYPTTSNFNRMFFADVKNRKILVADLNKDPITVTDPGFETFGHAFISPGEEFVLIDVRVDTVNYQRDIFVSFREEDGGWSELYDLGLKVNTEVSETCPSLSHDGKFLFFSRYNDLEGMSNIYWIPADVIYEARK